MKLMVNGKMFSSEKSMAVTDLLKLNKIESIDMVAVELNNKILKRQDFETTLLNENDKVEFLYFMGGGQVHAERVKV
ncbi:MAG: sulfur carrier protein ThiS [Proteobacteria bacterium]|nr:sulfur carrier protein ThiS [Pseudomonadota bacterium]MBU1696027.1 sulfur carrier protein ThiS [Pseudomonadota bacterium]